MVLADAFDDVRRGSFVARVHHASKIVVLDKQCVALIHKNRGRVRLDSAEDRGGRDPGRREGSPTQRGEHFDEPGFPAFGARRNDDEVGRCVEGVENMGMGHPKRHDDVRVFRQHHVAVDLGPDLIKRLG